MNNDSTNTYEAYKIKKNNKGSYEIVDTEPVTVQQAPFGYRFLDDINKSQLKNQNNQNNQNSNPETKEKPKDQPTLNPQDTVPKRQEQNSEWNGLIGMIPKWYERRFA